MKFPTSRTEILDTVAATVNSSTLQDVEVHNRVRLALMHWNHVEDTRIPDEIFEGIDFEADSPIRNINMAALKMGAGTYIDEREESLNQQLKQVVKDIVSTHDQNIKSFGDSNSSLRMNMLLNDKAKIIEQLDVFNYQIIDRKIDFDFDSENLYTTLNPDELKVFFKKELGLSVPDFDIGADVSASSINDNKATITRLSVHLPQAMVKDVIDSVNEITTANKELFNDLLNLTSIPESTVTAVDKSIPNFKDIHDHKQQIVARNELIFKREQEQNNEFSM